MTTYAVATLTGVLGKRMDAREGHRERALNVKVIPFTTDAQTSPLIKGTDTTNVTGSQWCG